MTTPQDNEQYIRRAAVDAEGNRIGKITKVYLDDQTRQPEWILVETGLFGTRQSFAPIRGSRLDGEQLVVLAVSKDQVKDAPNIDPDARISELNVERMQRSAPPAVNRFGATARYPAAASRSACWRVSSLSPNTSWTTTTPGHGPFPTGGTAR